MASRVKNNTLPTAVPDLTLNSGMASDLRATPAATLAKNERDIAAELMNRFEPHKVIDAFEEGLGIKQKVTKTPKYYWRNVVLSPEIPVDKEKLTNLMNDPKYIIKQWKDSFSARGDLKIFIVYGEIIEEKPEVKEIK